MAMLKGDMAEGLVMTQKLLGKGVHLIPEGGQWQLVVPESIGHNQNDALSRFGLGAPVLTGNRGAKVDDVRVSASDKDEEDEEEEEDEASDKDEHDAGKEDEDSDDEDEDDSEPKKDSSAIWRSTHDASVSHFGLGASALKAKGSAEFDKADADKHVEADGASDKDEDAEEDEDETSD